MCLGFVLPGNAQLSDSLSRYTTQELISKIWANRNTDPELSTVYGLAAIESALEEGDSSALPKAYGFTGVAYRNLDQYIKSLEYYVKGWRSALAIDNIEEQAYAYMNLGNLNLYIRRPEHSKEYLESMSEILDQVDNPNIRAYYHHYYGRALMVLEDFEPALTNLLKALELRQSQGNAIRVSVCQKYLGDLYKRMGQFDQAKEYYTSSISGLTPDVDKHLYGTLLHDLSLILTREGNAAVARQYAEQALVLGEELGSKLRQREAHEALAAVERAAQNYNQVQVHLDQVIALNESLFSADLELQADLFDYELSIKELEFEREKERIAYEASKARIVYTTISIASALLVILFFGGRTYVQRQKLKSERENNRKITELNLQLEDKVEKRTEELKHKNEKLEQLSTYKQELTHMLAHDLKSPLGVIVGYSDLIEEKRFADKIRGSASAMLNMIYNMLDVQRFEEANMQLNQEPVALADLFAKAESLVSPLIQAKSIELSLVADETVPLLVDREIVLRVLVNLFDNAIKYTGPNGKIALITGSAEREGFVRLEVRDTGIGIDEADLTHLFDKYWHKTSGKVETVKSTGLGLSFCKMAVEEHGGAISARSAKGEGTSIFFELPVG